MLEYNPVPGEYAREFRRGKYRFEAALHAMDGAESGGLVTHADPLAYEAELIYHFPHEKDGIRCHADDQLALQSQSWWQHPRFGTDGWQYVFFNCLTDKTPIPNLFLAGE